MKIKFIDNNINYKTRLVAIQLVAQQLVNNLDIEFIKNVFDKNYRDEILEEGGEKIQYHSNFLSQLINYYKNLDYESLGKKIDSYSSFDRKFKKWDSIIQSIIFISISEIMNSKKNKSMMILNDYINISKNFVNLRETKLINLILDKLINEKI